MEDVFKKLQEIAESNPNLKKRLESYNASFFEFISNKNKFYSLYAQSCLNKFELLKLAFEICFIGSINQKKLIIQEKKAIKNILKKGKNLTSSTTINYSSSIDFNKNLPEVYKKLIQGLEIQLLETGVDEANKDLLEDVSTVRALLLYLEFLEISYLNLEPEPIEPTEQERRKYTIKQYSLAYIFDCNSIAESIPYGSKKELQKIGKNRNIGKYAPNTFYKNVTMIFTKHELNSETDLVQIAGEDWKEILFELTKYPEELKKFLQSKQL